MKRKILLVIYYLVGQYLPCPPMLRCVSRFSVRFRQILCRHLFSEMGRNINIQPHVYIGDGSCIRIGDNSGFGRNFRVENTVLTIGCNVLIASDVQLIGGARARSYRHPYRAAGQFAKESIDHWKRCVDRYSGNHLS